MQKLHTTQDTRIVHLVFRLVRFFFYLLLFAIVFWFSATVPLGKRTIFEHLGRIYKTKEAQEAVSESKKAIYEAVDKAQQQLQKDKDEGAQDKKAGAGPSVNQSGPASNPQPQKNEPLTEQNQTLPPHKNTMSTVNHGPLRTLRQDRNWRNDCETLNQYMGCKSRCKQTARTRSLCEELYGPDRFSEDKKSN